MTMTQEMTAMDDMPEKAPAPAALWKRILPLAVVAAGLAGAYAAGLQDYFSLSFLAESRESLTAMVGANLWGSLALFTLLYAVATAFSFPAASILSIFGGFLFGWWLAGLAVAIGATAGATAIFMVARSALGAFLRDRMPQRVKNLAEGFEKDAFGYLLVLRLAPVFPFAVSNVAPALFKVSVRTYVAATFLGILPGVFAYTWLGQGVGSVIDAAEAAGREPSVGDLVTPEITLAFAALAVVAAIPILIKKWRARAR